MTFGWQFNWAQDSHVLLSAASPQTAEGVSYLRRESWGFIVGYCVSMTLGL